MSNVHNTKIVLLDAPKCNLDQYRNDMGELAIYVPNNIPYQIVQDADELSDLDKMSSDYTTEFDMPIDNRTRVILQNVQYGIVKQRTIRRAYLAVGDIVMLNGFLVIPQTSEKIINNTVSYSFQVIGTHQTWKEVLRQNCLQNLSLGSFIWTEANLLQLMEFNDTYSDGMETIYPMLADLGKFHFEQYNQGKDVKIYDLRFLVYKLPIIKQMFALAGYCVKSTFLESEYFRKEAIYALKSNFYELGTEQGLEYLRLDAMAERSADIVLIDTGGVPPYGLVPSATIPLDVTLTNNNGYWNGATFRYQNLSTRNIDNLFLRLNVTACGTGNIFNAVVQPFLYIFDSLNNYIFDIALSSIIAVFPNQCSNYSELIRLEPIFRDNFLSLGTLNPGWQLEVRLYWLSTGTDAITIAQGSTIEYFFGGKHFYENENVPIASVLDCSQTLYDYLLDFRKHYNLRISTDESNKVVYMEPQPKKYVKYETYTQPEEQVNGFEFNQLTPNGIFDITDLINIGQNINKNFDPQNNYNRITFKFKDSTDAHPNYEPYKTEGNELWGKVIQIGNTNTDNELEVGMSIFEPTLNDFIIRMTNEPEWRKIYIPIMWESAADTDGTPPPQGTKYEPRTFHVFGWLNQLCQDPAGGALVSRRWSFENVSMIEVPTIAQALPPTLQYLYTFIPLSKKINNVFGDNVFNFWDKDIVTTFYKDSLSQAQQGVELTLDIRLSALDFKCFSIRQTIRIFSQNSPLIALNGLYRVIRLVMNLNEPKHAQITIQPLLPCE